MSVAAVIFRNPFPPHEALATVEALNIKYGRLLLAPSTASFEVWANDPALVTLQHQFGALVSIERDDGLFPWVGMVTRRTYEAGNPTIQFELKDHAAALFARAYTSDTLLSTLGEMPRILTFLWGDAATKIATVIDEASRRQNPQLLVTLDLASGGPVVEYVPQSVSILDFLTNMNELTRWEWGLAYTLDFSAATTRLLWRERIGQDLREKVVWEENRHFNSLTFTQDAAKFVETAVVIGVVSPGKFLPPSATAIYDRSELPPVLRGSVVSIDLKTNDVATLQVEADRLIDDPTSRGEHINFSVVESEILNAGAPNSIDTPNPGDIVRVRFSDAGVLRTRVARVLGTQHTPGNGIIEVEADLVPEEQE